MPTRRDISPYLVHLTRDYEGSKARDNLRSILESRTIEARNPYGVAIPHLRSIGRDSPVISETQRVVCFSETPPDDLHGLINPGVWRRYHFRPYGVAFTREFALDHGANPVWYLNSYIGKIGNPWLVKEVNAIIDAVATRGSPREGALALAASPIAKLTPYMEVMGAWEAKTKDFTFEREWRRAGNFAFLPRDLAAIVVAPGQTDSVRADLARSWDSEDVERPTYIELSETQAMGERG
jgi:hypothetical protein